MGEYIAKQGDTWDLISYNVYGNEYHMSTLILANYIYVDVVVFEGGEILRIPELNTTDTSKLAPWRQ